MISYYIFCLITSLLFANMAYLCSINSVTKKRQKNNFCIVSQMFDVSSVNYIMLIIIVIIDLNNVLDKEFFSNLTKSTLSRATCI